jgi:hypothetical protein
MLAGRASRQQQNRDVAAANRQQQSYSAKEQIEGLADGVQLPSSSGFVWQFSCNPLDNDRVFVFEFLEIGLSSVAAASGFTPVLSLTNVPYCSLVEPDIFSGR